MTFKTPLLVSMVSLMALTACVDPNNYANDPTARQRQGAIMGGNRFPVDIPRLVDFYLRGLLDLDTIVAETIRLDQVNEGYESMKKGDAARSVIVFNP